MVEFDEKIINAENEKIKEAYTELGELYYKAHKKDYESCFEAPVAKIKAAEKAIEQHKAEVLKANGLMLCKHCGSQIQDISRFCNFCGKAVDEPVEDEDEPECEAPAQEAVAEEMAEEAAEEVVEETGEEAAPETAPEAIAEPAVCPNCGEPVEDDFDFCTNCGTRVRDAEPDVLPEEDNQRVCRTCGAKLSDGMIFCEECGTRVSESETKEKVCPICGFKTTDSDVNFCVECGSKLQ